jgi:putative salt-induced outer membrane protein YdiY
MTCKRTLLSLMLLAASGPLLAQEERSYDASLSLGYVGTTGNTDTTAVNAEALLTLRAMPWTHNFKLQGLGAQKNEETTAERYYLEGKSDRALNDTQYVFGKGTYTDDRFSGFDYQATAAAGYGIFLLRDDTFSLEAFGGPGYRESKLKLDGAKEGEGIIALGENFSWKMGPTTELTQSFNSDIGEELTVSRFEVGLVSTIMSRVATKIAFQARNISEVPVGNKNTDTQTSVSLVYTF